ncbi:Aromatic ring-opening dioxygenase, catalytic subunit, LigB family [Formivibrio citricus]|uniref:Aromatic ring-opening dioxygenase, catalytic subunit, LigB family n=1 Tax=Formivibrio citricus TaxID=83765 RepID=A0A1I4XEI8_9NEIS|nr:class III extradiol ring-cleavage dioxygenase [Formivibrio citricus]SFN23730.1 Aromatic ring-opening dioxygenase, catalytic subunit, LigB family [Formivibrio citricus]
MSTLPALFVSHGSPMLAQDAGHTGAAWQQLFASLPRPQAILVLSAHWLTPAPQVSATALPKTIHDFGGFPRELYGMQYPAPGAPQLAGEVAALLDEAGFTASLDPERGLDHGAWVPLRLMASAADIPVLQLSLQPQFGPDYHYRLGQALAPLRSQGVLLLGSGSLTHNLFEVQWNAGDDESAVPEYVYAFQRWVHEKLLAGDTAALLDYRRQAPSAERAHPTEEHLLPLFAMLGAGSPGAVRRHFAGITEGVLAMDVYSFGF